MSRTTITVSLALLAGLALGHATEQSMNARLSANVPLDPVERFGLGQNAFATANAKIPHISSPVLAYAEVDDEAGRYVNGARVLTPFEPARKIERLRLERVQDWSDENFDTDIEFRDDDQSDADDGFADYQPIDVGAVEAAPETAVANTKNNSETPAAITQLDERKSEAAEDKASRAKAERQSLSHVGGLDRPMRKISDLSHNPKTPSIP